MNKWIDIPNTKGFYSINTKGEVKSNERVIYRSNGRKQLIKERILKPCINSKGYQQYSLNYNGKANSRQTHVMLAECFLNHIPNGFNMVVDHINNNKLDNRLENLQIISHRENCRKDKLGRCNISYDKRYSTYRISVTINGVVENKLGVFKDSWRAEKQRDAVIEQIKLHGRIIKKELPFNCEVKKASKYLGIYYYKKHNNWSAYFGKGKNKVYLGKFKTEEEARKAQIDYGKNN